MEHRSDVAVAVGVALLSLGLTVGWFATGNASAPDDGLQQIDVLMLDERVPGVSAVDGRPTMVVATGQDCPDRDPEPRRLAERYGLVLSDDPDLARKLALPKAAEGCVPGYALLDGDSRVRYRSYDPGWTTHSQEQEILLEAIERGEHG